MNKIPFCNLTQEEKEERLRKTLAGLDLTKGFVNMMEEFLIANPDVLISSVSEFSNFIKGRKK